MADDISVATLGQRLRELREGRGWTLREVAAKAGVNHGYLSQLERGEVTQPAPSMLHRLADGYGEPFVVLMKWAGYVDESPTGKNDLSPTQVRALKYLGDDVSDEELDAIRAVLDVIRKRRATFAAEGQSLDRPLSPEARKLIRAHVLLLLRRADALNVFPTPLERAMEVAGLVAAGEITLEPEERRQLRRKLGAVVDRVLSKLQGALHIRAREVWIQPDLYEARRRFVLAHEIGHDILPWQHDVFAYLDDEARLRPDVQIGFEREANQAAIELLAQGDHLRAEADDSRLSTVEFSKLSAKYGISMQAVSRRIVEETRQSAALAIRFRGPGGRVGPYHVYCSESFARRFGWVDLPREAVQAARAARQTGAVPPFYTADLGDSFVAMDVDVIDNSYATLALFTPSKTKRSVRRLFGAG